MASEPQEIARGMLKASVEQGIVDRFVVRKGGRATIYWTGGEYKTYTKHLLDTIAVLKRHGWLDDEA